MTHPDPVVEPGTTFVLDGEEHVIRPRCLPRQEGGSWLCAAHGVRLSGVDDLSIHLRAGGRHAIVWMCPVHGAEVP